MLLAKGSMSARKVSSLSGLRWPTVIAIREKIALAKALDVDLSNIASYLHDAETILDNRITEKVIGTKDMTFISVFLCLYPALRKKLDIDITDIGSIDYSDVVKRYRAYKEGNNAK